MSYTDFFAQPTGPPCSPPGAIWPSLGAFLSLQEIPTGTDVSPSATCLSSGAEALPMTTLRLSPCVALCLRLVRICADSAEDRRPSLIQSAAEANRTRNLATSPLSRRAMIVGWFFPVKNMPGSKPKMSPFHETCSGSQQRLCREPLPLAPLPRVVTSIKPAIFLRRHGGFGLWAYSAGQ